MIRASELWKKFENYKKSYIIATVCNAKTSSYRNIGESFAIDSEGKFYGEADGEFREFLITGMNKALKKGRSFTETYMQHRTKAALLGATCGERTSVFFQYMGAEPLVMIFGAGNLGLAVARIMVAADYEVIVFDEEKEFLDSFDGVCERKLISFKEEREYPKITERDLCLVLTRGHTRDFEVLKVLIKKSPLYLGMVGSAKKNCEVKDLLFENGYTEEQWNRIKTPVGIDIGASTPGEIAVAIAAEVIGTRNGRF